MQQEPVRRQRSESGEMVADLRDLVSPAPLVVDGAGLRDPRWSRSRGTGVRCDRCRRRLRDGEPVLLDADEVCFCGLCGRRQWVRQWEDPSL
jgi:hypothetical protein